MFTAYSHQLLLLEPLRKRLNVTLSFRIKLPTRWQFAGRHCAGMWSLGDLPSSSNKNSRWASALDPQRTSHSIRYAGSFFTLVQLASLCEFMISGEM